MEELKFQISYRGEDAERHVLPAHLGAQSIEGVTWSLALLGNYLASGTVRRRGNLDRRIKFYMAPSKSGSFVTDIIGVIVEPNNLFLTSILGTYAVSTASSLINSFFSYSYKKVCGLVEDDEEQQLGRLSRLPSGDLEAVLDAIEPAIKRAHYVIGAGATDIHVRHGSKTLVTMDSESRAYVNESIINDNPVRKIVRVGALNVNSGNGRAFLPDVGKTAPFSVVKEPSPGTYAVLSGSLNMYARGLPSDVSVVCREVFSIDGRIKKLLVIGASTEVPV